MKILHLIDSLNAGGAERMAVAYANALLQQGEEVHLWSTREEGMLKDTILPQVQYHFLNRKGPIGLQALFKASKLIKAQKIQIIHAHSTSFFIGTLLKWLNPSVILLWHDHYGKSEELESRKKRLLKFCSRFFDLIFTVNQQLENWAKKELNFNKVHYIRNFSAVDNQAQNALILKGKKGSRIVCVANLRPQKNHLNLLMAFMNVAAKHPEWTLHLLGKNWDDDYLRSINTFILTNQLVDSVFYYGSQSGISALMKQADIGVLSSDSEGLPLAIIEYALAGLPVVTTNVGYCAEVVGEFGKVVLPKNPSVLAEALEFYISNPDTRAVDAAGLILHVQKHYTEDAVIPEVLELYRSLIKK